MPVKKILKQQTAVISIPDKLLNDKDKIVNGLTKKGNLVRKSVIIKSNDGNDIKILKKGIKEGSTNNNSSSSPPKEKKVKEPKEKKVKEPKEKKVKELKENENGSLSPSNFKSYSKYDEKNFILKFPDNMKTYKERNSYYDNGIKIIKIESIEKRYYKYVKPEAFIDFSEIKELYKKYNFENDRNKIGNITRSNLGTTFSILIPVSLLTYFFNKKDKFITDDELKMLKIIEINSVNVVPIVIEHFISNIKIQGDNSYFNYCCMVIPTYPKAKRIWLADMNFWVLDDILQRGLIMIFKLKTNKILNQKADNYDIGEIFDNAVKKNPEILTNIKKLLKVYGI